MKLVERYQSDDGLEFQTEELCREYEEKLASFVPDVAGAVYEAVSVLYLADSSDYKGALWQIIKRLHPTMAELLENDPELAMRHAGDLAGNVGE